MRSVTIGIIHQAELVGCVGGSEDHESGETGEMHERTILPVLNATMAKPVSTELGSQKRPAGSEGVATTTRVAHSWHWRGVRLVVGMQSV